MLNNPDPKVLEALVNLEANGNFRVVMEWIKNSKEDTLMQMCVSSNEPLYRTQGAFGVLNALHNHSVSARAALAKLSTRSN